MAWKKKPERGFKTFQDELKKNTIKPVILLEGVEAFQMNWVVRTLESRYIAAGMKSMDYAVFTEEDANSDVLISSFNTFTMLSEKRIVWVRDIAPLRKSGTARGWTQKDIDRLVDYVKSPNENSIVIFSCEEPEEKAPLVKALRQHGSVYSLNTLGRAQLAGFASKRFRDSNKEISQRDLGFLLDSTGYLNKESEYRLFEFDNDIKKIIAHSEGDVITKEDIEAIVVGDGERFIFDLLDGISGNDKTRAFAMIHTRLSDGKEDEMFLVTRIAGQMELLLEIREFMDVPGRNVTAKSISDYTGLNKYRVEKAMDYARRYSTPKLRKMVLGIYEVNQRIVSGLMPARMALEMFVASI